MYFTKFGLFLDYLGVDLFSTPERRFFNESVTAMIQQRRHSSQLRQHGSKDFLQIILNAGALSTEDRKDDGDVIHTQLGSARGPPLSDIEIGAQIFLFLMAGYATTATTLHYALFLLASHPEVQESLLEEIQSVTQGRRVSYEDTTRMPYLDAVIAETLRLYPPTVR